MISSMTPDTGALRHPERRAEMRHCAGHADRRLRHSGCWSIPQVARIARAVADARSLLFNENMCTSLWQPPSPSSHLEGAIARAIASCSTIHHMHLRGVVRAASFVKFVKAAPRAGLAAAAAVALVFLKGEPQHRFSSRVLRTSRSLTPAGTASRANRVACTFLVFSSAMAPWRSRRRPRGSEAVALRAVKGGVGLGTVRTLAFAVAPEGIVAENEVLKAGKQRKMRRVSTVRKPRRGAFATRDMRILVLVGPHRCARMS